MRSGIFPPALTAGEPLFPSFEGGAIANFLAGLEGGALDNLLAELFGSCPRNPGATYSAGSAAMAATASQSLARLDPGWVEAWRRLPAAVGAWLELHQLASPTIWAFILPDENVRAELRKMILAFGWASEVLPPIDSCLSDLLSLRAAACAPAFAHSERVGRRTDLEVGLDCHIEKAKKLELKVQTNMRRLAVQATPPLPAAWTSANLKRKAASQNTDERQKDEEALRARWGAEVQSILMTSGLPFAAQAKVRGGAVSMRCCRGLRPSTLSKRVRDWRPFARFLAAHGWPLFPTTADPILHYFEVREAEGAPRTWFGTFLHSLRFFETAGERDEHEYVHNLPAVKAAALEAATARALSTPAGSARGRQAPPMLARLIVAFEEVVMNTHEALFVRCFAWYRLLRHWTAMRWDDTVGLNPTQLRPMARGLAGQLERTKVSGPGKKTVTLPIFVSFGAHVSDPAHEGAQWLRTGFELWTKEPMWFPRDYLLPLPNADLSGVTRRRAKYSDCSGFSRLLMLSLRDHECSQLMLPASAGFWTEHSDRSGVDSWLSALGVSSEDRAFLGRWGAKGSADLYARTAFRMVENLQLSAAAHAQDLASGGADHFGEEHTLQVLREWLQAKGVEDNAINDQVNILTLADFSLNVAASKLAVPAAGLPSLKKPPPAVDTTTEPGDLEPPELDDFMAVLGEPGTEIPLDEIADTFAAEVAETIDSELDEETIKESKKLFEERDVAPPSSGFVISLTTGGFRRLHFVGACFRVPGEHYKHFIVCGMSLPADGEVDARCRQCFRGQDAEKLAESDDSDSSSSTSTSALPSAAKKPSISAPAAAGV